MLNRYSIFGPCAAESREQVLTTAKALQTMWQPQWGRLLFRAGIWKPRTSPDTFQGIGEEGLAWLREIETTLGLDCITEVATPQQLKKALEAGLSHFWIGARTSADPQAVQAIAEAVDERVRFVAVKNPVNEDLDLWMGNVKRLAINGERLAGDGLRVIAVHRGCNHRPCWRMAYQFRKALPHIPLLLDPSHMSGQAQRIHPLVLKAAELGYDGWMIEVHPEPEKALSDSRQQIRPDQLNSLLQQVDLLSPSVTDRELLWLRAQIDEVDARLWATLAERMAIVRQIGIYKQAKGLQPFQPERYQAMLQERLEWGKESGLPQETVRSILDAIHSASVQLQG